MKPIVLKDKDSSTEPIYIQLYRGIREEILGGSLQPGEKLPSLRALARSLEVSVTTSELAYHQLLTEGYIVSRAKSGYYVADLSSLPLESRPTAHHDFDLSRHVLGESTYRWDLASFDFFKWKKCMSRVLTDYPQLLLWESDSQGEEALRYEISRYVYSARGVVCRPEQVVIGAGTQQLTSHLCRILRRMQIDYICTEEPGYLPIQNIFRDLGFAVARVPVAGDGICIDRLPVNVPSAVYVSPSNQFPTGSIMPIGQRYRLLEWAKENGSYILEDDYDSELRYFGKPIPALQGLDQGGRVVYLGSFSSTLFPAIKISYMILPESMRQVFDQIKGDYTQTCSKTEQLTLALFMEEGLYQSNIRKLRNRNAQKLQLTMSAMETYGKGWVTPTNTHSGLSLLLAVTTGRTAEALCEAARCQGLRVVPVEGMQGKGQVALSFYYNQIPVEDIDGCVKSLLDSWKKSSDGR